MTTRYGLRLLGVLALGAAVHAAVIALTPGEFWDIHAIGIVGAAFDHAPLHVYAADAGVGHYQGVAEYPWPYLPAYLPVAGLLHFIAAHGGPTVSHLDRALISLADLALAWIVAFGLGRAGRGETGRLAAAALVALGPCFVAVGAVHGQLDALAWLPAAAAFPIWARRRGARDALVCGALIGVGVDLKTAPALALIALGLAARDRRELLALLAGAAGVVALSVAPFAAAGSRGLGAIVGYSGFPGRAGLTALLQPRLTLHLLGAGTPPVRFDGLTHFLLAHGSVIVAVAVVVAAAAAWRSRLDPADTMAAMILAVYVFAPAVLPQYWVWLVPFLLLAGRLRAALIYQLALVPLLVATYAFLQEPEQPARHLSNGLILHGYVPVLWAVTLGLLGGLVLLLARPLTRPFRSPAPAS